MSILINAKTRLLIQGITGNEGSRVCVDMLSYGTRIVAGVTPGKGGIEVEGVPVYNSVAEAKKNHREINCSLIVVPARFVRDAAEEAIGAKIPLVVILTEHVPTLDTAWIIARARKNGTRIVGPSSIGIISPGESKVGAIGIGAMVRAYTPGPIGLISKSGGMTSEIALALTNAGFGQSTAIGAGADVLAGSDFSDIFALFAKDEKTKAVVMFGEIGGTAEERVADFIRTSRFKKPVVALIAGNFGSRLPKDTVLGHAGAIVSQGQGSYASKISALKSAGVLIANHVEEIPAILTRALKKT
ncbi:MAG: CoA-binding protein [Minisyncoccia bacterium]